MGKNTAPAEGSARIQRKINLKFVLVPGIEKKSKKTDAAFAGYL